MIRPSSYSILNQHAVLAHRCCVRRTAQVQTRGVVFLAGGGCRRVAAPGRHQDSHHRQQQQQHRKVATSGDASAETALGGGGGGGVAAAAAAGSGSTGGMEQQTRQQATHAISNPVLANIEKRWDEMPPQEQANLWMSLRDRQKVDWHDLTLNEKKAAYWIAFGPHGPRTPRPAGANWQVFKQVMQLIGVSIVIFAMTRYFANPPPRTMNKEWQIASNEYLKKQKAEPITGYSSPDYKGKGLIQGSAGRTPKPLE